MFWQIFLQIVLILLYAVLSYAESAFVSLNPAKIEDAAENGDKKAKKLRKLLNRSARVLSSMKSVTVLTGFTAAAFAAGWFAEYLTDITVSEGLEDYRFILSPVERLAVTAVLTFFMLIFGEIVPRRAALRSPEKAAMRFTGLIGAVNTAFSPLVAILDAAANGILRLMGINPDDNADSVTEEEIIMMSDAGAENGTIDETESRIIKNIFAFDDMTAEQICTHRTDISLLWSEDPVETWEETIHRTRHSMYPICGESVDDVLGILNAKDYFRLEDKSRENIMAQAVREPYFVHENMKADRLFAQMKKAGAHHFAVVVDEYGGMSGIITVTDLVEQLVGEFDDDELEQSEPEFRKIGDMQWLIPGITSLDDVCEELDVRLETDRYDTFGGYIIAELGEIPKDGTRTTIECDGLLIEVLKIHHHRIELTKVTKRPTVSDEDDE